MKEFAITVLLIAAALFFGSTPPHQAASATPDLSPPAVQSASLDALRSEISALKLQLASLASAQPARATYPLPEDRAPPADDDTKGGASFVNTLVPGRCGPNGCGVASQPANVSRGVVRQVRQWRPFGGRLSRGRRL